MSINEASEIIRSLFSYQLVGVSVLRGIAMIAGVVIWQLIGIIVLANKASKLGYNLTLSRSFLLISLWPILFTGIKIFGPVPTYTRIMEYRRTQGD